MLQSILTELDTTNKIINIKSYQNLISVFVCVNKSQAFRIKKNLKLWR